MTDISIIEPRTYEVTVSGFPPIVYSAQTPAKARSRAWRDYIHACECTFKEFLSISKVRRCDTPADDGYGYIRRAYGIDPKVGERIALINEGPMDGKEGTVVYPGTCTAHVHVQFDDNSGILSVHPMSIRSLTGGV